MGSGNLDGLARRKLVIPSSEPERLDQLGHSLKRTSTHRSYGGLWVALLVVVLATALGCGVMAQPILAALPVSAWPDRLALASLAKPGVYLVLFQNPKELRPTGGFLGSFAEVETDWGFRIKHISVDTNIYNRDKLAAQSVTVDPPEPLRSFLADGQWTMRDSNWAIDYPEAAQTVAWFYDREGGRPVDGVIATDARLFKTLLAATGSIEIDGKAFTSANAIDALEGEIEKDYWQDPASQTTNQPKSILNDLLPVLLSRTKALPISTLSKIATDAFADKELMVYVRDPELASVLKRLDWDGHVDQTTSDYFAVNEANLTSVDVHAQTVGAKSSWSISRTMNLNRDTQTGIHTATLAREHTGYALWPDGPNDSFLRVAVPSGSELISATRDGKSIVADMRLSQESGKTVFGFWDHLDPGQKEELQIIYKTPNVLTGSLFLQYQPGVPAYPIVVSDNGARIWSGKQAKDQLVTK